LHGARGIRVDTWVVLVIALARGELAVLCGAGRIVRAANAIINVFAIAIVVGFGRITNFEAEVVVANEVVPFRSLDVTVVVPVRPSI